MSAKRAQKSRTVNVHLISDSTGETAAAVARACLVQFENVETVEHVWPMVRSKKQATAAVEGIEANPGVVIYTVVDRDIQDVIEDGCQHLQIPCVAVLDPLLEALHSYIGTRGAAAPGRQHEMDAEYFARIEAVHFVLSHDDGQSPGDLHEADVVLAGVSRTLKTPTCIYLANRGVKAANIPILAGQPLPPEVLGENAPLVVGLTKNPKRLVEIRRARLQILERDANTDYADIETVSEEIRMARALFAEHKWPVIDVTQRSVEEVAATIMQLCKERQENQP